MSAKFRMYSRVDQELEQYSELSTREAATAR